MTTTTSDSAPLTVVLVHGAFTDASSWNGVIERLQAAGQKVTAPAAPAARHFGRLGLHRVVPRADPGTGPRRRPLLRRCGHLDRRHSRE